MTQSYEELREGSAPPDEAAPDSSAEARAQTRASVTQADSIAFQAVTHSARAAWRLTMAAIAAADRAGSLGDAQPPTLRQARDWHHRCAGHYEALILRWPRLAWGYVHLLLVKPALNAAEWVTASPIRSAVVLAVFAAFWFGR
jgi:hypothetical protein